jgi:hypothetical protein
LPQQMRGLIPEQESVLDQVNERPSGFGDRVPRDSVLGVYATCWRRRVDKLRVLLVDDVCMDNLCGSGLPRAFDSANPARLLPVLGVRFNPGWDPRGPFRRVNK